MARNLKKTLQIEDVEYNINAVYSDEAGKVTKPLIIKESLLNGQTAGTYNGSIDPNETTKSEISFVPSSGGLFDGPIFVNNKYSNEALSEVQKLSVINLGQIEHCVSQLKASPAYVFAGDTFIAGTETKEESPRFTLLKSGDNKYEKINTIIGKSTDFDIVNALLTTGSAGLKFNLVNNVEYEVTGVDTTFDDHVIIPYNYNGKPVTGIAAEAFKDLTEEGSGTELTVIIPDSVISIGSKAFYNTKLNMLQLSANTKTIAKDAFGADQNTVDYRIQPIHFNGTTNAWNNLVASTKNDDGSESSTYDILYHSWSTCHPDYVNFASISKEPFIYLCSDLFDSNYDDTDRTPRARSMYLKLPNSNDFIEVATNATRLTGINPAVEGKKNYYTYEGLAEIIARINKRLDGIGVGVTNTVAAPLYSVEEVNTLLPDVTITDSFDTNAVPTVQQLEEAISQIQGKGNSSIAEVINTLDERDSLLSIRQDLDDLTTEVYYNLENPDNPINLLGDAVVEMNKTASRIDRLEELANTDTKLENLKDKYVTKTVGGISANKTLGAQLGENGTLEDLIKKLLGITSGKAPSDSNFKIKLWYNNGGKWDDASQITAALNAKAVDAKITWSGIDSGTFEGNYTYNLSGSTALENIQRSGTISYNEVSGTIDNIKLILAGSHTSATCQLKVTYPGFDDIKQGNLGASTSFTINRNCYYGAENSQWIPVARTSKTSWTVSGYSVDNDYFVILYPKDWGTLSSIIDNDTQYEALGSAFNSTPRTVTANGGEYYQYSTIKKQNGKMNFTVIK